MNNFQTLAALSLMVTAACSTDSAKPADSASIAVYTAESAPSAAKPASVSSPAASGSMLDPNTATANDISAIPGLNADMASAILAGRPYSNMVGVDKILAKSLTDKQRDSVYSRLWTPIDLNSATGDEILLIPGVGARMRHEFEEYRPYTSIEQFRREIGKYVDKGELARLEHYVTVKK